MKTGSRSRAASTATIASVRPSWRSDVAPIQRCRLLEQLLIDLSQRVLASRDRIHDVQDRRIVRPMLPREVIDLDQDRFGDADGRASTAQNVDGQLVVGFSPVQGRDERSGVDDHDPASASENRSARYFSERTPRSVGPSKTPA